MKKIITCAGYHGTGSSLVTDLLKEFEGIKSFGEEEFRFLQDPNGLGDLEERILNNNSRLNSDRAIYDFKRFIKQIVNEKNLKFWKKNIYIETFNGKFLKLTNEYIESLIEVKWKGNWVDTKRRERDFFNKIIYIIKRIRINFLRLFKYITRIDLKIPPILEDFYFSYPIENFSEITKEYLEKLWEATKTKEEILVFDQLVPVCNTEKYIKYFNNIKVIKIDRDPRDIYILCKFIWKNEKVIPVDDVNIFIKHFKAIRKHQKYERENSDILSLKFEDAIYNYEETIKKIVEFLGIIDKTHIYPRKYFNPDISINNTQLYLNYPDLKEDIEKIEKELSEFCYEFPPKIIKNNKLKIF